MRTPIAKKAKHLPDILIKVRSFGFSFLLDDTCKHNLCTPCFADFFREDTPAESRLSFLDEKPLFDGLFQKQGESKESDVAMG